MRVPPLLATFAVVLAAAIVPGCDPGYVYSAVDATGAPVERWYREIEGVTLEGNTFETLASDTMTVYGFDLNNRSGRRVTILGGKIVTGERSMMGHIPQDEEWTFRPGTSGTVNLRFDYARHGGDAGSVLGPSLTWSWLVRIGDQERTVEVEMKRE
jgi:hypothetical protein